MTATAERARLTGVSTADAVELIAVAVATTEPESFGGAPKFPRYAQVAVAITSGSISVEVAHRITTFLDSVRLTVDAPRLQSVERLLLERAMAVGIDGLARYFKLLRARITSAGGARTMAPTDLENGVLLCAFHHWCVHHDGWQIFRSGGRIWFRPPMHLDPEQRPRPGRRATLLELKVA